jgi:Tat protein secretion system quality control protein TatD with DNase activity
MLIELAGNRNRPPEMDDDYVPIVHNDIEPQFDVLIHCFSAEVRDLSNLYSHSDQFYYP